MMLAVAAQFRPWMVELKLVEVYWTTATDPLLARMARLNAMLYNLNGYLLEHFAAGAEIEAYLQQQEAQVNSSQMGTALRSPSAVFQPEPPQGGPEQAARPASSPPATPAGRSFADLFRDTLNKPEAD
jgi:cell division septation protein DedD